MSSDKYPAFLNLLIFPSVMEEAIHLPPAPDMIGEGSRWEVRTWELELECADGQAREEEGVNGKGGSLSPYMGGRDYEPPPA